MKITIDRAGIFSMHALVSGGHEALPMLAVCKLPHRPWVHLVAPAFDFGGCRS